MILVMPFLPAPPRNLLGRVPVLCLAFLLADWNRCWLVVQAQTCSESEDGTCQDPMLAKPKQKQKVTGPPKAPPSSPFPAECGLYMAESTIPGAGIGIFTAVEKRPGDTVGTGDVCLPVMDMSWHNEEPYYNPFGDYFWAGDVMGMDREVSSDDIEAYCPGLDCAINCHLALINVEKSIPQYDEAGLHRSVDPGVGSFTPYHNGTTLVSRHIPAGGELFKFYGDNWFETREDIFGEDFPLSMDFPNAEELLARLMAINVSESILKDTYGILANLKGEPFLSRTLGALPMDFEDAKKVAEDDITVLYQPAATRSIEWLRENGRCIDNLVPGKSTIKQAARGAFATRHLFKGEIVTTSPLHHLPEDDFVNMYAFERLENGEWLRHVDEVIEKQVILNYCYGHPDSTLLLCPYGAGINYINHNQTQANLKIRWAEDFELGHNADHVENGTVEDLKWNYSPQFAFDYVALRDIEPGEELFLDYGDAWEQAWQEHVENFVPPAGADKYKSGHFLNTHYEDMPLRTEDEQQFDPYPEHLQLRCHDRLKTQSVPSEYYHWKTNHYGFPCRILDRFLEDGDLFYTVELEVRPDYESKKVKWIERTDVPRSGIHFFDYPGDTDMHLPNAFRRFIDIPDEIFPKQWMNRK